MKIETQSVKNETSFLAVPIFVYFLNVLNAKPDDDLVRSKHVAMLNNTEV